MTLDEEYMGMALKEAVKGGGHVNPNPQVGAVLVKDGRVIARGHHERFGGPHAERMAFAHCEADPRGATLYVTLEPCCHTGKTPPCTDIILEKGIARVVVGSRDPNPLVDGGGIALLKSHGVAVEAGVMKEVCDAINRPFFHYITHRTPWVQMKVAMTADGHIATRTGASRWVSGEESRAQVQELRGRLAGIMVGVGTVLTDDPLLTCRLPGGHNPVRIICDTHLRTPLEAQVVKTAGEVPTLIATAEDGGPKAEALSRAGCTVLPVGAGPGGVDLKALMAELGQRGIDSVLLEGGAGLNESALRAGIVQALRIYLAPKIFGGKGAPSPVGGLGVALPDEAWRLKNPAVTMVGEDICVDWAVL